MDKQELIALAEKVDQDVREAAADSSPHNGRWGSLVRHGHMDADPIVQASRA